MKKTLISIFLFLFICSLSAKDWSQGDVQVIFKGSSTLHKFEGKSSPQHFNVSKEGGTLNWSVRLPIDQMDTGNRKRDRNMRKMFQSHQYPYIEASFAQIKPLDIQAGNEIPFSLRICDAKKELKATISNTHFEDGNFSFTLQFPILLDEFQLEPPSAFFFIHVANDVLVDTTFNLY